MRTYVDTASHSNKENKVYKMYCYLYRIMFCLSICDFISIVLTNKVIPQVELIFYRYICI